MIGSQLVGNTWSFKQSDSREVYYLQKNGQLKRTPHLEDWPSYYGDSVRLFLPSSFLARKFMQITKKTFAYSDKALLYTFVLYAILRCKGCLHVLVLDLYKCD